MAYFWILFFFSILLIFFSFDNHISISKNFLLFLYCPLYPSNSCFFKNTKCSYIAVRIISRFFLNIFFMHDLTISPGAVLCLLTLAFSVVLFLFFEYILLVNEGLEWLNFSRIPLSPYNSAFQQYLFPCALTGHVTRRVLYILVGYVIGSFLYVCWVYYTIGYSVYCLALCMVL